VLFRSVGGRVADFRRDGARTLARPDSVGPFTAVQVAAATPTPAQLGAYVGAYASPELGVTHTLALRGDTLRLEVPGEDTQPLVSMDTDGFRSLGGGVQITFTRDRRGQVDGFEVIAGRGLHLRFDRVAAPRRKLTASGFRLPAPGYPSARPARSTARLPRRSPCGRCPPASPGPRRRPAAPRAETAALAG